MKSELQSMIATLETQAERAETIEQCRVRAIEAGLRDGLEPARALPGVADVRVLGAIGVIEMDRPVDLRVATAATLEHGVWLRPFRNLVYTMPPYICTPEDIAQITSAMVGVADALG